MTPLGLYKRQLCKITRNHQYKLKMWVINTMLTFGVGTLRTSEEYIQNFFLGDLLIFF